MKELSSTAEAARLAASSENSAAIASDVASQLYSLKIIAKDIEESGPNFTRFLIISKSSPERTGRDKTSVMFSIKDRVGALYDMLRPFKKYKITPDDYRNREDESILVVDHAGEILHRLNEPERYISLPKH